jgi:TolB-like protein/Tfp pilus assembly protein PilF
MTAAIRYFWIFRGYLTEGLEWSKEILKLRHGVPTAARWKILSMAGNVARYQGDYEMARGMYEEGLTEGRAAEDLPQISLSCRGLGGLALEQGDHTTARRFCEEALSAARKSNDKFGIARSLNILGDLARAAGDDAAAIPLFEEALAICRQLDNKYSISNILTNLAAAEYGEGDYTAAYSHCAEGLRMLRESGDKIGGDKIAISYALDGFAAFAVRRSEPELAARLAGAAEHLRESIRYNIEPAERRFRERYLAELHATFSKADFIASYEQGRKLKVEEAVAMALAETGGETETDSNGKLQGNSSNEIGEARTAILTPAASSPQETPAVVAKPESQVSLDKPETKRNWLLLGLLSLFILTAGFFAYRSFAPSRQIESIAVMPFVNESGNADVEYLSDGMTETLIKSLSQLPRLSVKARSSVFRYKGKDVSPQTVGNELSVQAVLLGRVIQRGDQLTLSLELVDAGTENVIWSEQYSRRQTDLVSLQSEIAHDVSNKLRQKLTGADEQQVTKTYTENTEAYQLYLRGRYHWNKRTPQGLQKSIEYFNQAVAVDPAYALAYAGLADSYALLPFYADTESAEAFPKAKAAATKALEIDDLLAEAHTTLAHVRMWYEWDWSGAERGFKRAIELNSNYPTAHHWYSLHLSFLERPQEALTEIRRAYELDPFSLSINLDMGVVYFNARQYDEAIKQFYKTLEMNPDFFHAHLFLADTYEQRGMYEEAAAAFEKVITLSGGSVEMAAGLRNGYKASGERGYFQEKLKLLEGRWRREKEGAYQIAEFHASLGEQDRALEWLEKLYERRDMSLVNLRVTPKFDVLRSDPRFQDLLRRVNLPQ